MPSPDPGVVDPLVSLTGLSPLLVQVLVQRGMASADQIGQFLNPEQQRLPSPLTEFPDLTSGLELLVEMIQTQGQIAICGDYDADGMTSTALLLRALRSLGGRVDYTIPSRMQEGYGLNLRMVEECHAAGVRLILTVDNGIAAYEPIERARQLGLAVLITDHHDLPARLPPANAILNPKLLPPSSPYYGVAGVGVAYILAICLAQALGHTQDLTAPLLELFTLGTIADLAPLTGVNRRWVRRGLALLPRSRILGIQALIEVAGLADQSKPLKPEHIGFRLGPRINAVGRLSDPQIVIDLLTTDDVDRALSRALECEQINTQRQELCLEIEQEAVAWCEQQLQTGAVDLGRDRVLLLVQPRWHHGVIGIVASRLVERYGVPVFIATYEDEEAQLIRGSARGIPEFDVFGALQSCADLLEKFGGHRAAGGFSFRAKHLRQVHSRLVNYAGQQLRPDWLKPLITIDAQAQLGDLTQALYDQIDQLHPCGIQNPDPVFWTPNLQVLEQQVVGRNRDHLKLVLQDRQSHLSIKAIAWRWGDRFPLPTVVDVAYKLKLNEWQGTTSLELELVGVRSAIAPVPPGVSPDPVNPTPPSAPSFEVRETAPEIPAASPSGSIEFTYSQRCYWVSRRSPQAGDPITIGNPQGQTLRADLEGGQGWLEGGGGPATPIDMGEPHYANLIQAALAALQVDQLTTLLAAKEVELAAKERQIQTLRAQLADRSPANQPPAPGSVRAKPSAPPAPTPLPPQVRTALGDQVWFCLSPETQAALDRAWPSQHQLQGGDLEADYSSPALALGEALRREVLDPLIAGLQDHIQQHPEPDLVALATHLGEEAGLAHLPLWLQDSWQAISAKAIAAPQQPQRGLRQKMTATTWVRPGLPVTDQERRLLAEFLQTWQHPLAAWLIGAQGEAATYLAQIHQLHQVALEPGRAMPPWQYQLLCQLVLGTGRKPGLLQKVFGA
ncbi:MAG: single-stranded-DNA-specific exonuclease RecJ [Nodosilinea sp.]